MNSNHISRFVLILNLFAIGLNLHAQAPSEAPINGAPEGYVFDEQGRIVSGTEPKKTRIYIGVDKSGSMRSYSNFISDGARSLVQGLSERACADWEVVVYEIGAYSRNYRYVNTTRPAIVKSTTPNGLSLIRHGITSRSAIGTGEEAPLNSLLSIIKDHQGSFEEVDFVASILITDTLIHHEPLLGIEVATEVKSIIHKPFKSWSFSVFPENISEQCYADIEGTRHPIFSRDREDFMLECLMAQFNNNIHSGDVRSALRNEYGRILDIPEGKYCHTQMLKHFGGQIEKYFGDDRLLKTYKELIEFNRASGGVSAPICEVDISFSFNAITSSILEELGCKMLYLM